MRRSIALAVCILAAGAAIAQDAAKPKEPPKRPTLSESVQALYSSVKRNITAAADVMPEEQYGFKPTTDVRSFGEIVGHVANAQFNFCAAALGVANPNKTDFEKLKTKKELVDALKESNAFCDGAYAPGASSTLEADATFGGRPITRGYALVFNVAHDNEHYGNLVTYMRLKNIVPPSTARNQRPAPAK